MRPSLLIILFLIMLSASANVLVSSGVAGDMGIAPDPGGEEEVDSTINQTNEVQASNGLGSTLFGMYSSIAGIFEGMVSLVFAGPIMLYNIGIPRWILDFVFSGAAIITAADIIYLLTGRDI